MNDAAEIRNYAGAVACGAYERDHGGLYGKHDNVRRCWEDQANRLALREVLAGVVEERRQELSRVRILDLGCGAGEGFEIVSGVRQAATEVAAGNPPVLPEWMLGAYRGVDFSPAMVDKARELYAEHAKLRFDVADLRDGLPVSADEEPYDFYFSSFGSLSHLDDEQLGGLLDGICEHMGRRAVFVADMLGRYSYEWPCYWDGPPAGGGTMQPYSMSYIHPPELRDQVPIETMAIRYWGGTELSEFVAERVGRHGRRVVSEERRDRSIVVGRHMDTAEYNPAAQPIRQAVSSLHEANRRTDLTELLFDFVAQPGHPEVNTFLERYQIAWNTVVLACMETVASDGAADPEAMALTTDRLPAPVSRAIETMVNVVEHVGWFDMGDPLANLIEPQLGHVLRTLEGDLQQGLGAAHGLLGIFVLARD